MIGPRRTVARLLAVLAVLAWLTASARAAEAPPSEVQVDMTSKVSGRTYRVWIARPLAPAPPGGYPVIYVMDGNGSFRLTADQMRVREFVDLKPAIVVGVGYPSDDIWESVRLRTRDLTYDPPTGVFLPVFDGWGKAGHYGREDAGGGELFFRFLTEELRPKLAAMMPVDPANQALFGHSLGGLFTLDTLYRHPAAFSAYIAASPSIAYNARGLMTVGSVFKAALERGEVRPRILLEVGGEETYPSSTVMAAMSAEDALRWAKLGRESDDVPELAVRLKALKGREGYEVRVKTFAGENHLSVLPAALSRALTFAFTTLPPVD